MIEKSNSTSLALATIAILGQPPSRFLWILSLKFNFNFGVLMMTRKNSIKSISLTTGTALALSVMGNSAMAAQTNPFVMIELNQGYAVAAAEAKCGEGKCGGNKETKPGEAKCGGSKDESADKKSGEGKCGEGKCGEGKCGGNKKTKPTEAKCGGSK